MENTNEKLYWGMNLRTFTILMHLSQFAGAIIPYVGFVLPLVMWLTNKDQDETIDKHGKNIVNWLISGTIYAIVSAILTIIIIGIPLLIALGILAVVFPIIGAVKASDGEIWQYPLCIKFIK